MSKGFVTFFALIPLAVVGIISLIKDCFKGTLVLNNAQQVRKDVVAGLGYENPSLLRYIRSFGPSIIQAAASYMRELGGLETPIQLYKSEHIHPLSSKFRRSTVTQRETTGSSLAGLFLMLTESRISVAKLFFINILGLE
ncbi:hypothetical protein K435DRAFT_795226 [Dendrothele bispora CBS 962.96]|uniref:Uncharacterized protein n=1 Tax=Dendrothele bispora (strain CBS 962.96) TaxID=1314807 RepID=A0A4S8M9K1_DENBC|nr:hypothetical protein K435DRAFT_795226 [Dendrothele bispora CBS 962.96]